MAWSDAVTAFVWIPKIKTRFAITLGWDWDRMALTLDFSTSASNQTGAATYNIEQTLTQFEAQVIPDDHPLVPKLNELFGDHTFFLNIDGLNVVEPKEDAAAGARAGTVVNLANWTDAHLTSLALHEPEPTEITIILETAH